MTPAPASESSSPRRILIVRPSALGDVCRTVPALVSLRRHFDAKIDWVVQSEFASAVSAHPDLSEALCFPRKEFAGWFIQPTTARQVLGWLGHLRKRAYDLVFDLQGLGRSGLMTWATRSPRRVGFRDAREFAWLGYNVRHRFPIGEDGPLHTVDRMLALLRAEGINPVHDMRLYVNANDQRWWQAQRPGRYAVLAPTARWRSKRWPVERWRELVSPLLMRGFERVIVIGAPGEEDQVAPLFHGEGSSDSPLKNLVGSCTIGQTMAIIESASLVVANDSAPLHMAVGFDVPCLGLFGPTDPAIVGPYQKPLSALRIFTPRPGEIINYRDPKLEDRLMRVISTAAVIQKIDRVLAAESSGHTDLRSPINTAPRDAGDPPARTARCSGLNLQSSEPKSQPSAAPHGPLFLASASPRRLLLLNEMGLNPSVIPPDIDDGRLSPGAAPPADRVLGLAYLKARRVANKLHRERIRHGIVLGADTVCVHESRVLGQPRDADEARGMLQSLRNAAHRTMTGVCLINLTDDRRLLFHDEAEVRVGDVSDDQIEAYVSSGEWRGKAGGYNLSERIEARWPIECTGDPTTVMGLPVRRLSALLARSPFSELLDTALMERAAP